MLKDKPMTVCIRGLEYMNDDPWAVDVLYAKVSLTDDSNRYLLFLVSLHDIHLKQNIAMMS